MKRKDKNGIVLKKGESQLEDGRYRYRYKDDLGKEHDVYAWTLRPGDPAPEGKKKEESLREKEEAISKGLQDGLAMWEAKITLNELVEEYLRKGMDAWSNSTYNGRKSNYNKHIKPSLGRKKVVSITRDNIYDFYNALYNSETNPLKLSTIEGIDMPVRMALDLAVERGIIRANPATGVVAKLKRKRADNNVSASVIPLMPADKDDSKEKVCALEDEQQERLLNFIKKYYGYLYYYPLFYLLAWTGCRIGEALALTWYDVDFKREVVHIRRSLSYQPQKSDGVRRLTLEPPKTDAGYREIPMLADVKKILLAMKNQDQSAKIMPISREGVMLSVDNPAPFIFRNRDGKLIHYSGLARKLHAIISDYNSRHPTEPLPQITCHVFRHTFTCWLCENVSRDTPMETIKYIQSILGHADAKVTLNVYAECRRTARSENHEELKKLAANDY